MHPYAKVLRRRSSRVINSARSSGARRAPRILLHAALLEWLRHLVAVISTRQPNERGELVHAANTLEPLESTADGHRHDRAMADLLAANHANRHIGVPLQHLDEAVVVLALPADGDLHRDTQARERECCQSGVSLVGYPASPAVAADRSADARPTPRRRA